MPEQSGRAATGVPFVKGDPRAGRRLGSKNRATKEIQKLCTLMLDEEWLASAKQRLLAGEAPHIEKFLLEHRFGKPKEHIEVTGVNLTELKILVLESRNGANGNGSDYAIDSEAIEIESKNGDEGDPDE